MSVAVVHRYWNPNTHDHLYTTNAAEIGTTHVGQAGNHGYTYEGESFTVFNHHHAGLVPVYRYWNPNNHDHFYTANVGEIGTTHVGQSGNHGYTCEGVLGYVSPVEFPGSVAIHRYWNDGTHDHLYTASADEIGTTHVGHAGKHGYKYEGAVGYAYPAQHHVSAVYRYWNPGNHDHFYTASADEIGTTVSGQSGKHGYTSEGVAFHIFNHHHHGLVPVHRYWHPGHHDHFYTSNTGEIGTTTVGQAGNHGYSCEGVLGYVSPTHFHGGLPVYRYWNANTHDHLYTTNTGEIGTTHTGQAGNHGYTCEGILGYVPHH
jgi:uncharacterized protein YcgI (DUF1989 family)